MEIPAPIKGQIKSAPLDKMPPLTSPDMNNMRPIDVLEKRLRLSQRPGQDQLYTQRIGGNVNKAVLAICSVTTID
ncbi:hypothetical protein LCGC14_1588450 [marine sediment metagenome]|uniref:Uncharacterized protein n=1 Tax=marine sediment metagenome TaxID=412755 RepID=A0A0F9J0Z9_9ZZZZ